MNVQNSTMNLGAVKLKPAVPSSKKIKDQPQISDFETSLKNVQKEKQQNVKENQTPKSKTSKDKVTLQSSVTKLSTEQSSEVAEEKVQPTEQEIIKNIAEKLEVSVEEVQELLNQLGLTVADLFTGDHLQLFIQRFFNVEDSSELLTIPNAGEIYKDIQKIMDNLKEQYPQLELTMKEAVVEFQQQDMETMQSIQPEQTAQMGEEKVVQETQNVQESPTVEIINENDQSKLVIQNEASNDETPKEDTTEHKNNQNDSIDRKISLEMQTDFVENESIDNKGFFAVESTHSSSETVHVSNTIPKMSNVDTEQLMKQIVDHMKVHIKEDSAEMTLKLKPDHLGKLELNIVTERGIVTAQFVAESQRVKEIIEANFNQLKDVLQDQGLKVEALQVSVDQNKQQSDPNQLFKKQSKSKKRIGDIIQKIEAETEPTYEKNISNSYESTNSNIDYSA